jgi:uncharacterized integral membrane protein
VGKRKIQILSLTLEYSLKHLPLSISRKDVLHTPPPTFPLSNVTPASEPSTSSQSAFVQVGTKQVSLPALCIGITILLLFLLVSRAFLNFSASIFRLAIILVLLGAAVVFAPLSAKVHQQMQSASASPGVSNSYTAPTVDGSSTSEILEHYRRQHEQQQSTPR